MFGAQRKYSSSFLVLSHHLECLVSKLVAPCHTDRKVIFPLLKNKWLKQTIYLIGGR